MEYQQYMNLTAAIVEQAKRDSYGRARVNHSIGYTCDCNPPHSARTCAKTYLHNLASLTDKHMTAIDLAMAVLEAAK